MYIAYHEYHCSYIEDCNKMASCEGNKLLFVRKYTGDGQTLDNY